MKCDICRKKSRKNRFLIYGQCLDCYKYHCVDCMSDIHHDINVLCPCQLPSDVKYIHHKQRFSRLQLYLSSKTFKYFGEKISLRKILKTIGEKL